MRVEGATYTVQVRGDDFVTAALALTIAICLALTTRVFRVAGPCETKLGAGAFVLACRRWTATCAAAIGRKADCEGACNLLA